LPATEPTSIWHERCAVPSMWMVQAPHRLRGRFSNLFS
jgi:uncharacterized protein YbdZ (MbtH family)